jgi:AcrR family transcriptional regulator
MSDRRQHLVETALDLFGREGFRATGIDRILAESGVAKMTLYKHFRSKEDLILAALKLRSERFRRWLEDAVARRAATPRARLVALFDVLGEWIAGPDFRGCTFINACAEFGAPDDPLHRAAAEHKRLGLRWIEDTAAAAGAPDPRRLAERLFLLHEGAIVAAQSLGWRAAAETAKAAAEVIIAAELHRPAGHSAASA